MRESLGLVETRGISTAIQVADVMVKAANVKILELENSRGSGYMTVKIVGDVGAVKAAVQAAKAEGARIGNLVSASVIARPSEGMATLFCNPKVPYQSVNKKPVFYGVDDKKSAQKSAKKDEPKKAEPEKAEVEKVEAKEPEVVKVEPVKEDSKQPEPKEPEPKTLEPEKVEPVKKAEAPKAEPKVEAPKTVSKVKPKVKPKRKK